jgi:hypothetical protein
MRDMDESAEYQIRVQGELDTNWSDRLGGMNIATNQSGAGLPVTTLLGRLPDQAALSGIMETLYELHLRVLDVKRLDQQEN